MKSFEKRLSIDSSKEMQFIDITESVAAGLRESKIGDGVAIIFSNHTTASVRITERCERLQTDMLGFLKDAVPEKDYLHDKDTFDDRPNARRHLMALFMNASETLPVKDGKLALGRWQSVFFVELDGPRKNREILLKIMGE